MTTLAISPMALAEALSSTAIRTCMNDAPAALCCFPCENSLGHLIRVMSEQDQCNSQTVGRIITMLVSSIAPQNRLGFMQSVHTWRKTLTCAVLGS